MPQLLFTPEWLSQFNDPYAVLGLSVAADDQRVLKRYRAVARLLHPDGYPIDNEVTKESANQILARIVNPAYQKLRQEKGRADVMAMLRFRVRRASREAIAQPESEVARKLLTTVVADVEVFYEQAIAQLAQEQYHPSLENFELHTQHLGELNLVYLRLKMGEPIREQRTGLAPATEVRPIDFAPVPDNISPSKINYAQRHYHRAKEYVRRENWSMAIKELKDAIQIESKQSEYHSLLARAYLMQNLPGMAKVHVKRAFQLNPNDPLALELLRKLKIKPEQLNGNGKPPKNTSLLDRLVQSIRSGRP